MCCWLVICSVSVLFVLGKFEMVDESIRKRVRLGSGRGIPLSLTSTSDITQQYDVQFSVGEGTYGIVHKAVDRQTKRKVAIKKFKPTKEGEGISLTAYREIMVTTSPYTQILM
jgi:serine/threonine protein kinase